MTRTPDEVTDTFDLLFIAGRQGWSSLVLSVNDAVITGACSHVFGAPEAVLAEGAIRLLDGRDVVTMTLFDEPGGLNLRFEHVNDGWYDLAIETFTATCPDDVDLIDRDVLATCRVRGDHVAVMIDGQFRKTLTLLEDPTYRTARGFSPVAASKLTKAMAQRS